MTDNEKLKLTTRSATTGQEVVASVEESSFGISSFGAINIGGIMADTTASSD